MPKLEAGRLRHQVRIERPIRTQDPITGNVDTAWVSVATVYAAIEPLSAKDFIAAQQMQSSVSARIVIRWRSGLTHDMRFVHTATGAIYTPAGFLADPETGREYITVPCSC